MELLEHQFMASTTINFLSSDVALGKQFWVDSHGELNKSSYPNVREFTSHAIVIDNLREFHAALVKHATLGYCLIKGKLSRALSTESRAGSTKSDDSTNWVCLDLDGAPYATAKEFMDSVPEFKDMAYIVQYSASYGINGNTKLSCHIFMIIDGSIPATTLKAWLIEKNLTDVKLREAISLSRTGAALHWPLDVTACQNDKLLYITPPKLGKGVRSTLKDSERIQFIPGKTPLLKVKHVTPSKSLEQVKKEERELRNELRKANGLESIRSQIKWVGDIEVQPKPGQATITGKKEDRGFMYFNLNGGDSWAYYHPLNNIEYIHNFKGEPSYATKELLPDYYKDCKTTQKIQQAQPSEGGDMVLAFRDKRTAAYWNGTWNEDAQKLDLHPAKSELQLNHWMQNHELPPFEVIPVWDMHFNPQSTVIIDEATKTINTYVPTPYFRADFSTKGSLAKCPLIKRIMLHAVSGGKDDETFEHWLNWLAVIFQHRHKPKTAWILHGTEGTGKGVIVNKVLAPLLGRQYVQTKRASELDDKFNGWLEQALIGFIDEIEVDAFERKGIISGDLRNFITEDWVTIRAMQKAAYQTLSYAGLIFSSNKKAAVQIDASDRRYNVGHFQTERLLLTQHEVDVLIPQEIEAFMHYIMTRPADKQIAATALKNAAHAELVENNKTSIEVTAGQLANGDLAALWDQKMDPKIQFTTRAGDTANIAEIYSNVLEREIKLILESSGTRGPEVVTLESKVSRSELIVIFEHCVGNMPKTPNKFTSMLKHRNIKTERMRMGDALVWGLRVEWKVSRKWLAEIAGELARRDGTIPIKLVKQSRRSI